MATFILRRFLYALAPAPDRVGPDLLRAAGRARRRDRVDRERRRAGRAARRTTSRSGSVSNEPLAAQYFIFIEERGDRRSRELARQRRARSRDVIKDAGLQDAEARLRRARDRVRARDPVRPAGGLGAQPAVRPGRAPDRRARHGHPQLLPGGAADPALRGEARLASAGGARRAEPPRAPGRRARDGVDGRQHAPDAFVDARGALEGLRPHPEREGPAGKRDPLGPRPSQRARAGDRARGRHDPARARVHADRRGDLPLRGPRVPVRPVDH